MALNKIKLIKLKNSMEKAKLPDEIENLKEKDRVVTVGGIHGVVTNVQRDAELVTLRVDESTGAKIRVGVSAISKVVVEEDKGG